MEAIMGDINRHNSTQQQAAKPSRGVGVEVVSVKADRFMLGVQDTKIEEMSGQGFTHYETFNLTGGEVVLRFRRPK